MLLKSFLIITLYFSLGSCLVFEGKGGVSALSSKVKVKVVAQFSDSPVRTSTARPYIRLQGGRSEVCRSRSFSENNIRIGLSKVSENILSEYFFGRGESSQEEDEEEEDDDDDSSNEEMLVRHTVGDNWIKFGLIIENDNNFILVINNVRLSGVARCGEKVFNYSDEKNTGYCSEGTSFPILYIISPVSRIDYEPENANPFHSLTLYFDGFEIEDRRGENSRRLQNLANRGSEDNVTTNEAEKTCGVVSSRDYTIPSYQLELSLSGYFIGLSEKENVTLDFFKRVNFSTGVIY